MVLLGAGLALAALPEIGGALAGAGELAAGAGEVGALAGEAGEVAEVGGELGEAAEVGGELGEASEAANGAAEGAEAVEMAEEGGEAGEAAEEAGEAAEEAEEEGGDSAEEAKDKESGKGKDDKGKKEEKSEEEKKKEAEEKEKKEREEQRQERIKEMNAAKKENAEAATQAQKGAAAAMQQAVSLESQTEAEVKAAAKEAQDQAESKRKEIAGDLKAHKLDNMEMADAFGTQATMDKIDGKTLPIGELLETVSGGKALRGIIPTKAEWSTHRHFLAIRGPEGSVRSIEPYCQEHEMSSATMASATVQVSFAETFGFTAALASDFASSSSTSASFSCPFGGGGGGGASGSTSQSATGASESAQSGGGIEAKVRFESRAHTLFKAVSRYRITLPEAAKLRFTPDAALRLNQIWQSKQRLGQKAAQKEDVAPIRSELGALTREFYRLYGSHIMRGPVRLGGLLAIRGEATAMEEMTAMELESSAATACRVEAASGSSSSVTVQGSVGFLGIGGTFSHSSSEQSGQAVGVSTQSGQSAALEASQKAGRTCTRTQKTWIGGQPTDDVGQWTASLLQGDEYLEVFDRGSELVPFWDVVRFAFDDLGYFKDVPLEQGEYDRLMRCSTESPVHGRRILGPNAHKDLMEGWVVCSDLSTDKVRVNTAPDVCRKLADFLEMEFFSMFGDDCYCRYCKGSFLPTELEAHTKKCQQKQKHETDIRKGLEDGDYELRQDDPLDDRTLGFYLVKPLKCPLCKELVPATSLDEHLQTGECTFDMRIDSLDDLQTDAQRQEYTDFKMHEVDGAGFKSGFYRLSCDCNLNYVSPPEGFALVPKRGGGPADFELKPTFVMYEEKIDDSIRRLFRRGYKRTLEKEELTLRHETMDRLFFYVRKHRTDLLLLTLFDPQERAAVRGCINHVREGETLMSIACRNGDVEAARLLIEQRASPNLAAQEGDIAGVGVETQPLVAAISRCHLDVVSLLLKHKANANLRLDGADLAHWADRLHEGFRRSKKTSAPLQVAVRKYSLYTSAERYDEFAAMHFQGIIALLVADHAAVALPSQWGLTRKRMLKFNPGVKELLEQAFMHRLCGFAGFLKSLIQRVGSDGQDQCKPGVLKKVSRELQELMDLTEDFAAVEERRLLRLSCIERSLVKLKALYRRMDVRSAAGRACCRCLQRAAKALLAAQARLEPSRRVVVYCEARPELHLARGTCLRRYDGSGKWSVQVSLGLAERRCCLEEDKLVPVSLEWDDVVRTVLPEPARGPVRRRTGRGGETKLALPMLAAAPRTQVGCLSSCLDGTFALLRRRMGQLERWHPGAFENSVVGPLAARSIGKCDELLTGNRVEVKLLRRAMDTREVLRLMGAAPCSTTLVRLHACRALTRLLMSGEAVADEAASNDAVETLLQLLRGHAEDALLQAYGCDALSRVLDGASSDAAKAAAGLHGHELLLDTINRHFGHKVTQAYACMALKILLGRHAGSAKDCAKLRLSTGGPDGEAEGPKLGVVGVLGEALSKGMSYHPLAQMAPVVIHAVVRQCQEDDRALAELLDGEAAPGAMTALKALRQSMEDYPNYPIRAKMTGFTLVRLCTGLLRTWRVSGHFSAEAAKEVCEALAFLLWKHPQSATRAVGKGSADLVPEIVAVLQRTDVDEGLAAAACRALRWVLVRCAQRAGQSQAIREALQGVLGRRWTGALPDACGALAELFRLFPQRAQEALEDADAALQLASRLRQQQLPATAKAEICRALAWLPLVRHHIRLGGETRLGPPELARDLMGLLEGETRACAADRCPRLQQQAMMCLLHLVAPEDVELDQAAIELLKRIRREVCAYRAQGVDGQGGLAILEQVVRQNPSNYSIEVFGAVLLRRLKLVDGIGALLQQMADNLGDADAQGIGCYQIFQAVAGDPLTGIDRRVDITQQLQQAKDQAGASEVVKTFADSALRELHAYTAGQSTTLARAAGRAAVGLGRSAEKDFEELVEDFRSVCGKVRRHFIVPVTDSLLSLA